MPQCPANAPEWEIEDQGERPTSELRFLLHEKKPRSRTYHRTFLLLPQDVTSIVSAPHIADVERVLRRVVRQDEDSPSLFSEDCLRNIKAALQRHRNPAAPAS